MPEQVVLEDQLDAQYVRHIHVMSAAPVVYDVPAHAAVQRGEDAGMHWLKASWLWRDPAPLLVRDDGSVRWVVLYGLMPKERISEAAVEAAKIYARHFDNAWPEYAWVRTMPTGIALGKPIPFENGELGLFDMSFLPPGFVAVG